MADSMEERARLAIANLDRLDEIVEANDGEVDDDMLALMQAAEEDAGQLIDQLARLQLMRQSLIDGRSFEIERLKNASATDARAIDRMKAIATTLAQRLGVDRIEGDVYQARMQANAPSVDIDYNLADLHDWPEDLVRVKVEPNKVELLRRIKDGESVPAGVRMVQSKSLRFAPRSAASRRS